MTETWLRLDQRENAIDDLAMCHRFLTEVRSESRWKWAIIALHQALYGFCICALQGTDALSVLKDPANPSSQLISIHEALKRAKDKTYLWPGATPLSTTPAEDKALDKVIREFRNGFAHFAVSGWSIETSGMPTLLRHVLRVVRAVALDSNSIRCHPEAQRQMVNELLSQLDAAV